MKNVITTSIIAVFFIAVIIQGCVTAKIGNKSGTMLWSENCQRCHNTPPSSAFTNIQWEIINDHMRQRAMLTNDEAKKIVDFIKQGD